jgi:stage III sporulation protein SpoIIIAA
MLILISKSNFMFSAFCRVSFVVQNAKSASLWVDNPSSGQTTLLTANSPKLSAIG